MLLKLKYYFNKNIRMSKDIRMIAEIARDRGFFEEYDQLMRMAIDLELKGINEVYKETPNEKSKM